MYIRHLLINLLAVILVVFTAQSFGQTVLPQIDKQQNSIESWTSDDEHSPNGNDNANGYSFQYQSDNDEDGSQQFTNYVSSSEVNPATGYYNVYNSNQRPSPVQFSNQGNSYSFSNSQGGGKQGQSNNLLSNRPQRKNSVSYQSGSQNRPGQYSAGGSSQRENSIQSGVQRQHGPQQFSKNPFPRPQNGKQYSQRQKGGLFSQNNGEFSEHQSMHRPHGPPPHFNSQNQQSSFSSPQQYFGNGMQGVFGMIPQLAYIPSPGFVVQSPAHFFMPPPPPPHNFMLGYHGPPPHHQGQHRPPMYNGQNDESHESMEPNNNSGPSYNDKDSAKGNQKFRPQHNNQMFLQMNGNIPKPNGNGQMHVDPQKTTGHNNSDTISSQKENDSKNKRPKKEIQGNDGDNMDHGSKNQKETAGIDSLSAPDTHNEVQGNGGSAITTSNVKEESPGTPKEKIQGTDRDGIPDNLSIQSNRKSSSGQGDKEKSGGSKFTQIGAVSSNSKENKIKTTGAKPRQSKSLQNNEATSSSGDLNINTKKLDGHTEGTSDSNSNSNLGFKNPNRYQTIQLQTITKPSMVSTGSNGGQITLDTVQNALQSNSVQLPARTQAINLQTIGGTGGGGYGSPSGGTQSINLKTVGNPSSSQSGNGIQGIPTIRLQTVGAGGGSASSQSGGTGQNSFKISTQNGGNTNSFTDTNTQENLGGAMSKVKLMPAQSSSNSRFSKIQVLPNSYIITPIKTKMPTNMNSTIYEEDSIEDDDDDNEVDGGYKTEEMKKNQ